MPDARKLYREMLKLEKRKARWNQIDPENQEMLLSMSANVRVLLNRGDIEGAKAELNSLNLDFDNHLAIWDLFESYERAKLK